MFIKNKILDEVHKTTEAQGTNRIEDVPIQQPNEVPTAPVVPKLDLPVDPPAPPPPAPASVARVSPREQALSIMAEKKRQKWIRDKGLNHFQLV